MCQLRSMELGGAKTSRPPFVVNPMSRLRPCFWTPHTQLLERSRRPRETGHRHRRSGPVVLPPSHLLRRAFPCRYSPTLFTTRQIGHRQMRGDEVGRESVLKAQNRRAFSVHYGCRETKIGGDAGIRTRGAPFRARRFSKPLVSATHPRLRTNCLPGRRTMAGEGL